MLLRGYYFAFFCAVFKEHRNAKRSLTSSFLISRAVSSQVPSAFVGLTTVFGMGTGGAPQLSSLDIKLDEHLVRVCSLKTSQKKDCAISLIQCLHFMQTRFKSSPRPISTSQLHRLLHFHIWPIYLIIYKGPYFFRMTDLILRLVSRLDAFSVYPFRT